jgi:uncharacterized protein YecE (DUF72 family)
MRIHIGTSGYSYKEWKGSFYPADLPAKGMLGYYGRQFTTVEINNTFYRMPAEKNLLAWAADVPDHFIFALKTPQRITHIKRLREAADDFASFMQVASVLGPRLGPTLVQTPPSLKKDLPRLDDFVARIPATWRAAFEFRHASWFSDDVYDLLRSRNQALCLADTGEEGDAPVVATADWGYLRLRRVEYGPGDLELWAGRLREQPWSEACVYFKHEDEGTGPRLAREFGALVGVA